MFCENLLVDFVTFLFLSTEKTIEGTVAGIASVLVACFILLHLASAGYILSQVLSFPPFFMNKKIGSTMDYKIQVPIFEQLLINIGYFVTNIPYLGVRKALLSKLYSQSRGCIKMLQEIYTKITKISPEYWFYSCSICTKMNVVLDR